jgi:hypothetical protein
MKWERKPAIYFSTPKVYGWLDKLLLRASVSVELPRVWELFDAREGWVKEYQDELYMIPRQRRPTIWSAGSFAYWVGVRDPDDERIETEKKVHSIGKTLDVKIDEIPMEMNGKTMIFPFYKVKLVDVIDILDRSTVGTRPKKDKRLEVKSEAYTTLMNMKEMAEYCDNWCDVLQDFPRNDFSSVNMYITKRRLRGHFEELVLAC